MGEGVVTDVDADRSTRVELKRSRKMSPFTTGRG